MGERQQEQLVKLSNCNKMGKTQLQDIPSMLLLKITKKNICNWAPKIDVNSQHWRLKEKLFSVIYTRIYVCSIGGNSFTRSRNWHVLKFRKHLKNKQLLKIKIKNKKKKLKLIKNQQKKNKENKHERINGKTKPWKKHLLLRFYDSGMKSARTFEGEKSENAFKWCKVILSKRKKGERLLLLFMHLLI